MIRMMNKKNILFALLLMLASGLSAQVWVESPLSCNSALIQKRHELELKSVLRSGGSITDTIILGTQGFLDDFSYEGPYPDTALWLNNYVYVNRDLPISPPTLGVATFDGVNAGGYPYNFLASQYSTGKADTLTSKPIDLDFPGDTTIYFSFFYQPEGRGNFPDEVDSLILEFKAPVTGAWHHVWATKGITTSISDSSWQLVMLHITDSKFLKKGFQFRFSNWATLSGSGDHWNVDYVYLRQNRTATDTIYPDVAFVYNTPSLLKNYTAMPWRQYDSTDMKTVYSTTIRNNNNTTSFGTFGYQVYGGSTPVNTPYFAPAINYDPYSSVGYDPTPASSTPALNYVIPPLTGDTTFSISSYLSSSPNNNIASNDTVVHKQVFTNYYAYDDGTAEVSFGLQGSLHAQIAEKFKLNVGDTLRSIDIFFNPQWVNASAFTFTLKVWAASGSGAPGAYLYINPTVDTPAYNQSGRNLFIRYNLDAPLYIAGGTTFFVGFDQNTTQPINIGVDKNTNSQNNVYYNSAGSWLHPPFAGSLMIRPILGSAAETVGIAEQAARKDEFLVYPNPASDKLFIQTTASADKAIACTIMDLFGRTVITEKNISLSEPVDLSALSNGVYFIRLVSGNTVSTHKFIVSK
ncbi:MAG: hypothetical protein JWO44_10 [Bacteroidetes bacterium]|nr:hypothetical protein [Bacteroidota bacterium]